MTNTNDPYKPGQNSPNQGSHEPPQFGQRSENWQPNPIPEPESEQSPWPVYQPGAVPQQPTQPGYGQQPPYAQQPPYSQQPQDGPTYGGLGSGGGPGPNPAEGPYGQPHHPGYGPVPPPANLPSRTWPILTLVGGVIVMFIVAPAIFLGMMLSGLDFQSIADGSVNAYQGGEVTVDSSESIVLIPQDQREIYSCTLTQGSTEIVIYQESATGLVSGHQVPPGTYTVDCGLPTGTSLYVFSGDQVSGIFNGVTGGFIWSSVVGVLGLVMLIVGIVWLVRRNRARREVLRSQWGPPTR